VFTDPDRGLNLAELAITLPAHSAVVYRHFGAKDRWSIANKILKICQTRNAILLIGADPELAQRCGAAGVHVPERMIQQLPHIKSTYRFRLISAAAHSVRAARTALALGADQVVLSSVFVSTSASANVPLGVCRFALAVKQINGPVIALGGIHVKNVGKLTGMTQGIALVTAANPKPLAKI